jgi:hypothetical protein
MKMRLIVLLITVISVASIIYGFTLEEGQVATAHKFIGGGTIGLFLVAMPLFLYTESQGKNMKDYMLTKENIKKMQENERKNTENQ